MSIAEDRCNAAAAAVDEVGRRSSASRRDVRSSIPRAEGAAAEVDASEERDEEGCGRRKYGGSGRGETKTLFAETIRRRRRRAKVSVPYAAEEEGASES